MSDTLQQPGLNSLSKSFEPAAIEAHWGPEWEQRGYAGAGHRGTGAAGCGRKPSFAIQLPPPNVTGTLHMGHAFNQTIMDSLTRYHRMRATTPCGCLAPTTPASPPRSWWSASCRTKAMSRHDLGRKNFVAKVWEWKEKSGNTITTQMRRMGDSVDWSTSTSPWTKLSKTW
jgi:valyl-tRNA synthetase